MTHTRPRLGGVAALLLVALLAACNSDDTATPTTTATEGTPTAAATASATPAETPPPVTADATNPDVAYATVTPTWIEGLGTATDSGQGAPFNYFVSWPVIDGYPSFGDQIAAEVDAIRQKFASAVGDPIEGRPVVQELNVTFDILVASGGLIGLRLQIFEFPGASGANLSKTLWFEIGDTAELLPPTALLRDDAALSALSEVVREALHRDRQDLTLPDAIEQGTEPTAENFHSIGFTADGDLLVEFDDYQVGAGFSGSPRVVVPAEVVAPWLSDFGRRAQQETVDSSEELDLPAPTPTPSPEAARPSTGVDCGVTACVALTFDDGPGGPTPRLLDLLAARGVHATFFVVGINVTYHPDQVARMAADGHEIGNHTYNHRNLTTLGDEEATDQIASTSAAVEDATGARPTLLRPPYGATDDAVDALVGMPLILWSVDPRDWADHDAALVTARVLEATHRGDIVLLHSIHETSVDAVPAILDGFAERGLVPVTVSELLASDLRPGVVYSHQALAR